MLNLELVRYGFGLDSTLGRLFVDGIPSRAFQCFTLEDERRKVKVKGETCIPPGSYEIKLRHGSPKYGKFDERWDWHNGMLWLQDVPGFEYIYIHPGNTDDDTDGCILVGDVPLVLPDGEFKIARSRDAYADVYRKVMLALEADDRVVIHVSEDAR